MTKPSLLDLGGATPLESTPLMMKPRLLSIGEVCMETGLTVDVIRVPPPRYSLGHPFGDNPLRGANEEEGRNPAGRGSGGRP